VEGPTQDAMLNELKKLVWDWVVDIVLNLL